MPERLQPAEVDRELTPIKESRAATGRRHLEMTPDAYDALAAKLNADHGNPREVGRPWQTLHQIPPRAKATLSADKTKVLLSLRESAVKKIERTALDAVEVKEGTTERTKTEFEALKPVEEISEPIKRL